VGTARAGRVSGRSFMPSPRSIGRRCPRLLSIGLVGDSERGRRGLGGLRRGLPPEAACLGDRAAPPDLGDLRKQRLAERHVGAKKKAIKYVTGQRLDASGLSAILTPGRVRLVPLVGRQARASPAATASFRHRRTKKPPPARQLRQRSSRSATRPSSP